MPAFRAKIGDKKYIAHEVLELRFDLLEPAEIDFKAGQFVMLLVPDEDKNIVKRAYSVASSCLEKRFLVIAIKLLPGGKASSYLREAEVGEVVELEGPFGHFSLDESALDSGIERILMVATGTGVAPMRSMILSNLGLLKAGKKMKLLFGVRSEEDIFWHSEFSEIAASYGSFEYELFLSQAGEDWEGKRGRVSDVLRDEVDFGEDLMVYLCGSLAMVNEVAGILESKGVAKDRIKREVF